jgi:hypothetical protein
VGQVGLGNYRRQGARRALYERDDTAAPPGKVHRGVLTRVRRLKGYLGRANEHATLLGQHMA